MLLGADEPQTKRNSQTIVTQEWVLLEPPRLGDARRTLVSRRIGKLTEQPAKLTVALNLPFTAKFCPNGTNSGFYGINLESRLIKKLI